MAYDDDMDPSAMMLGPDAVRSARVAALRGQQMPQQAPAELLLMSNPLTAHMGQEAITSQRHAAELGMKQDELRRQGIQMLANMRNQQAERALQAQHYEQMKDYQDAELGIQRQRLNDVGVNPFTGGYYNRHGPLPGAAGQGLGPPVGATPPPGSKAFKEMQDELQNLGKDISETGSRGLLPQLQGRLFASQRLKVLGQNPDGSPKDLSPQFMAEMAANMASLVSNGSAPAEATVHQFIPHTSGNLVADIQQFLSNAPAGTNQKAFVKQMLDAANREESTIEKQKLGEQAKLLAKRKSTLFDLYPDAAWNAVAPYGLKREMFDPKTLSPLPQYFGAADQMGGGGGPTMTLEGAGRPTRTVNGVTKYWDGKAWVLQ